MSRSPITGKRPFRLRALRFNLGLAAVVWLIWAVAGGHAALRALREQWPVALTMVFGSLVGGGTSEGGGAVAFPVFTKLLHIAPGVARNFALAVQSVGMGAASLSILSLGIPIESRVILYAGLSGIAGVLLSASFLAPLLPPLLVRVAFTVLVSSLGIALLLANRGEAAHRHPACPRFGSREKAILLAAGFLGGIVSAFVGTGENTVVFMVMVLLFRVSEKIVTPTTVILMSMVTIAGFLWHLAVMRDFGPLAMQYWLAAVPVVAVGAPLGALLCSYMRREAIVAVLLALIVLEFASTLLLVPMSFRVVGVAGGTLLVCGAVTWWMSRSTRYRPAVAGAVLAGEARGSGFDLSARPDTAH